MMRFLPVIAFSLLAAVFLWGLFRPDPTALPSQFIGKPAPAFEAPLLTGDGSLTQADLATGKPILVNVFASWCAPCRVEHKYLTALAERGVAIYGIANKDAAPQVRKFLRDLGDPYQKVGLDLRGRASIEWGVTGVPESFVLDGAGRVVYKHIGPINPGELESKILPALEAARG